MYMYCVFSSTDNCTHGEIRLVNGSIESEGRVEVCSDGTWGTVQAQYWTTATAKIACGQLGYSRKCKQPLCNKGPGNIIYTCIHVVNSCVGNAMCSIRSNPEYCIH